VYGFSAEEAMERLGANQVSIRAEIVSKKEKKEKVEKAAFPLPFSGTIQEDCCQGVKPNRGLYTQCDKRCDKTCVEYAEFCKGCAKQAAKNANGQPDYGIIANRANPEWRDAKGKAPTAFVKVMKKLKLTEEQVLAEVARLNVVFDAETHFAAEPAKESKRGRPKKAITSDTESSSGEKKSRGRPKKAAKVVEVSATEDLFATLVQDAKAEAGPSTSASASASAEAMSDLSGSESESESVTSSKKSKSKKMSAEEKAAKDLAKLQEKEAKDLAKLEAKAAKEQAKLQEKEAKEAAKAQEKAAKEEAKAQEKAAKAQEKAAKEAAKAAKPAKPAKAAKPVKAEKAKVETAPAKAVDAELEEEEEEEEEPAVAVSKFEFQGKTYLKSSNNVIYDLESQDEIGVWNAAKGEIEFQEYESESDDE